MANLSVFFTSVRINKQLRKELLRVGVLFLFSFVLIRIVSPIDTVYDYYTRLSVAFTQGRICLPENIPWLNELIPIPTKGYCVVYPITPALVMVPLVIFSPTISQTLIAHLFFAAAASLWYLFLRKLHFSSMLAALLALTWNFATIFLSLSAVGSAWYIAQTIGSVLLIASLFLFSLQKPYSLFFAGLLFGLAANARLPLHLYGIFFGLTLLQLYWKDRKKLVVSCIIFGLGFFPLFFTQRVYNYLRYDSFSDMGYYLIPGKFEEDDFKNGQFNPVNIPKHLEVFLFKLPKRVDTFPYVVPSYYGLSVLLTSPFLVVGVIWLVRQKKWIELTTVIAILLLEMSHGTVGFTQFGYRFGLDAYPLVFIAFAQSAKSKRIQSLLVILVIFSIVVNFWGVLAFRNGWFIW